MEPCLYGMLNHNQILSYIAIHLLLWFTEVHSRNWLKQGILRFLKLNKHNEMNHNLFSLVLLCFTAAIYHGFPGDNAYRNDGIWHG